MVQQTRIFNTSGPIDTKLHYNVPRTDAVTDLVRRIKDGRYVVIFAPRQTGKTTLFQDALEMIANEEASYYPLQLDFQTFRNVSAEEFYQLLKTDIRDEVERRCQKQDRSIKPELRQFLEEYSLTSHISLRPFLGKLAKHLDNRRIAIIIDEFDGIPQSCLADFLYTLRRIYHEPRESRCPYSVGIVGVKSINQLSYDRSISPFNIQDDFSLKNFTLAQVRHLLSQYTEEVGQEFDAEVVEGIHRQTSGQPFLVNRLAQILTNEMEIPLTERITAQHFDMAHEQILRERNTNIIQWICLLFMNSDVILSKPSSGKAKDYMPEEKSNSRLILVQRVKRKATMWFLITVLSLKPAVMMNRLRVKRLSVL